MIKHIIFPTSYDFMRAVYGAHHELMQLMNHAKYIAEDDAIHLYICAECVDDRFPNADLCVTGCNPDYANGGAKTHTIRRNKDYPPHVYPISESVLVVRYDDFNVCDYLDFSDYSFDDCTNHYKTQEIIKLWGRDFVHALAAHDFWHAMLMIDKAGDSDDK